MDLAARAVDRLFVYRIPEGMDISCGQRVRVPFGPRTVQGFVMALQKTSTWDEAKIKDVLSAYEPYPVILPELIALCYEMQARYHCLLVDALRLMIPAEMRSERVKEKTLSVASLCVDGQAYEQALASTTRAKEQRRLLELLKDGPLPVAILGQEVKGALGKLRTLEKKGYVAITGEERLRRPYDTFANDAQIPPTMTGAQYNAANAITQAACHHGGAFLLHGVTGSGKTEVYMRAVEHVLSLGKAAIIMVPEIALTPQMVSWFRRRFGQGAAVLHSALSAGEKFDEWRRIRRGEARVIIGARSAVFAPAQNLGIIIVDEEHESSYQSDRRPRYDAREVAAFLCEQASAVLVLGSATPSMVSFAKALKGVYTLLEIPERIHKRPLPEVSIVDMRKELMDGNKSIFSQELLSSLRRCLDAGQQAILFINRRGHSSFVSCRACGLVIKCKHCAVSMIYHQEGNMMRCHYCDAHIPLPETCPSCKSPYIKLFGTGTQKVQETFSKHFPHVKSLRMDFDTTQRKDAHATILQAFAGGEAQVLIGTQMIAKGLDFSGVTLVGIVAADTMLNLPDYRSEERTFDLITQVAGRAGRGESIGHVVLQTYDTEHYAIQLAAKQDYRAFFVTEMERRRRGLYPPYTVLTRFLIEGDKDEDVWQAAGDLEKKMLAFFEENLELKKQVVQMRAMEAPIGKIRNQTRWQVFLKLYAKGPTEDILQHMSTLARDEYGHVLVTCEVNPSGMV